VFTHPIWIHYRDKKEQASAETSEKLLKAANQLRNDDPKSACRILLVCAACQNRAGQHGDALKTMQQILTMADLQSLSEEILWAEWGACAICVQTNDFEQAIKNLQRMQAHLHKQNEWMLANYVETIARSLQKRMHIQGEVEPKSSLDLENCGLIRQTFDWLNQWGYSAQSSLSEFQLPLNSVKSETSNENVISIQGWRGFWQLFKQIAKGEMKLRWVSNDLHQWGSQEIQWTKPYYPSPDSNQSDYIRSLTPETHIQVRPQKELVAFTHTEESSVGASLLVYCLGPFQVYQDEQSIDDWPSSKGKAVFKYLITHRERPVLKDVLMDIFWSDIPADSARNNLNVAIYGLRQALRKTNPTFSHVLFENDCYLLNPELSIWLDYESFLEIIATARILEEGGELEAAVSEYIRGDSLYQGEFLEEDRYEDWLLPLREKLRADYLSMLDRLKHHFFDKQDYQACIHMCRKMLAIDRCSEEAHRHLMRCFYEQGQSYMALRQYHLCVEALKEGLNAAPSSFTRELYETIRHPS